MMKRISGCLLAFLLMLTPVFAFAQGEADPLTSGTWMWENASIDFKPDGTGVFVNNSGKTFDMAWTAQGNEVSFEYQFYGKRSETLVLAQAGGGWTLTDDDGNVYSQNGSAAEEESNAYTVAFGEELDLGFVKITFHRVQLMMQLHGSGPNSPYTIAADNSHYFALVGTLTNTSSRTLNVSDVFGEIMLDQYIYSTKAEVDHNGRLEDSISPMSSGAYYIYSTVPDTLTKIASSGEVKLAFNFDFAGTPSSFDRADFVFQVALNDQDIANAWKQPEREMAYFSECPALPMPSCFADVSEVSMFTRKDNVRYSFKKLHIYDEEENLLPNANMTLEKYGTATALYSCITPGSGRYYMYEPDAGTRFFYLHGSFNNTGGVPLDIRHVYAELIFDDTYHYDAACCGVRTGASNFINAVAAQTSCKFYVFASVPPSVLNSYKTCVIKLGFTDGFEITVNSNGLPAFSYCDDVYEVKVNRR